MHRTPFARALIHSLPLIPPLPLIRPSCGAAAKAFGGDGETWMSAAFVPGRQCVGSFIGLCVTVLKSMKGVSFILSLLVWIVLVKFTEQRIGRWRRFTVGTIHAFTHIAAAVACLVFLESLLELGHRAGTFNPSVVPSDNPNVVPSVSQCQSHCLPVSLPVSLPLSPRVYCIEI